MKKVFSILIFFVGLFFGANVLAKESGTAADYLFSFAAYSDSHGVYGQTAHRTVMGLIEQYSPDFVLHSGDFVTTGDSTEDWQMFDQITANYRSRDKKTGLKLNFYPTPGNHDEPLFNYFSYFNLESFCTYSTYCTYYHFDYKNVRFISLDTNLDYSIYSEQYLWLDNALKNAGSREIIVFFHKPPYSSGYHGQNNDIIDSLVPLFEKYKVKLVLNGHDHEYERSFPIIDNEINAKGVTYIVNASAGGQLRPERITYGNWWTAKIHASYGFIYFEVFNGVFKGKRINSDGSIFDEFEITLPKAKKSLATMAGFGGATHLRNYETNGKLKNNGFYAFSRDFIGGGRIASGDVDLDGKDEIIVGAGKGDVPQVKVFERDGKMRDNFFAFEKRYKGGLDVAVGDVDGDGKDEIAVSKMTGKSAVVKVFRYNSKKSVLFQKHILPKSKMGATVALADVDGDGKAEVLIGTGQGKHVSEMQIFDVEVGNYEGTRLKKYVPFGKKYKNGLDVAGGDLDGDGMAEIVISKLGGVKADVRVYEFDAQKTLLKKFRVFPKKYGTGVNVDVFDVNFDGREEILVGMNEGKKSKALGRVFDGQGKALTRAFRVYNKKFKGGVSLVGINE